MVIKMAKERNIYWPRLTHSKQKPAFVAVDHERWEDETSDEEEKKSDCLIYNKSAI